MRAIIALFATAAVMFAATSVAQDSRTPDSGRCFNRVIKPTGWEIPEHSRKPLRTGVFQQAGLPNLTFTTFAVSKTFFLPHYYVENGALNIVSLRFRTEELQRLEVAGKPFAFVAAVRGVDVGTAGSVWWVDKDGSGTFVEFAWSPTFELPHWVKQRATTSPR